MSDDLKCFAPGGCRNPDRCGNNGVCFYHSVIEATKARVQAMSEDDGWKERLRDEHNELVDRLSKLKLFIRGLKFQELSGDDKMLLMEQYTHMKGYERVLSERIVRL